MIRFNQIAWPDIALLFRLKTRGLCTHFTACASFYFFLPNRRTCFSNLFDSRILSNSKEFHGLFVKKERKGGREGKRKNYLSARKGVLQVPVKGRDRVAMINWNIDRVQNSWYIRDSDSTDADVRNL